MRPVRLVQAPLRAARDPSALSSLQSEAPSEASSGIRLPSVAEVSGAGVLSAPVSDDDNDQINWLGIISWVCIGIGILIVVVVILSNRRPPRSGYGRTRYKRQKSAEGQEGAPCSTINTIADYKRGKKFVFEGAPGRLEDSRRAFCCPACLSIREGAALPACTGAVGALRAEKRTAGVRIFK